MQVVNRRSNKRSSLRHLIFKPKVVRTPASSVLVLSRQKIKIQRLARESLTLPWKLLNLKSPRLVKKRQFNLVERSLHLIRYRAL
jgi:hypothetical protein